MFPLLGGLVSGAASMFSGMMNNENNQEMQQQAQAYNTQMSNTAYQRASQDMQAAGLNPAMMFGHGSAASSPTAVAAVRQDPIGPGVQKAMSSAMEMKTWEKTIDNLTDQNAKLKAEVLNTEAETRNKPVQGYATMQHGLVASKDAILKDIAKDRAERDATEARIEKGVMDSDAGRTAKQASQYGKYASDAISPVSSVIGNARGIARDAFNARWGKW